jgi:hypothetical protein
LIIRTIRRDPSGADQIDAEHQATELAVGFESLAAAQTRRLRAIKQEKLNRIDLAMSVLDFRRRFRAAT